MKKLCIPIILLVFTIRSYTQVNIQCGEVPEGVGLDGVEQKEFNPSLYMTDIWINPDLLTDRRVFFVHGLGGQGDEDGSVGISWSQASYFSDFNYMINSARPDYADISLAGAADELKGDLEMFDDADDRSFIIAHSQGGIVSRQVDYYYTTGALGTEPRTFGGIVTFGSPHQGALILNNRDDLVNLLATGCSALTAGPVNETIDDNFWMNLFLDYFISRSSFEDYFCNTFENNVVPYLFKDYYSGITESYMVGSPELATLNAFTPEIPYVCFYGVETEPLMWNTLVHALPDHEPNNTMTYGFEPFGATDDTSLVHYIRNYTQTYLAKYVAYDMLADFEDAIGGGGFPAPGILGVIDGFDAPDLRDDYLEGYLWLVEANAAWRGIIGADEYVESSWTCHCDNEHEMDLTTTEYTIEPGESCDDEWGDCITTINYTLVQKESDGIVLKESASECLGQIPGAHREMEGSNHFSMRNDSNTKIKLEDLYAGNNGLFFFTMHR